MQLGCQPTLLVNQGVDTCDEVCDIDLVELLAEESLSAAAQFIVIDTEAFDLLVAHVALLTFVIAAFTLRLTDMGPDLVAAHVVTWLHDVFGSLRRQLREILR